MGSESNDLVIERLRMGLDLFRVGVDMMRQRLRRKHPDIDSEELEHMLFEWIRERPGAEHGDANGRVSYPHEAKP